MTTGAPLDLAIEGEGYFVINTPQGDRYTRNGNFYRSPDGTLITSNGMNVLNPQGRPIRIPPETASITVGAKGRIQADGQAVGQLALVQFDDRRAVLKQGDNLYYAQEGADPQPATGNIMQGVLERSNANVVNEMGDLNHRVYEANSKAVTTQDEMLDHSVNEVGTVS